jgi:hypothetical protein
MSMRTTVRLVSAAAAQRAKTPTGDSATPWLQAIDPSYVDTAKVKKPPKWHVCFSNASVSNPWRVTGLTTMKAEVALHQEIGNFGVWMDAGATTVAAVVEPVITSDNLSQYYTAGMPPLFYPTCGCQKMPGFPQAWGGK